MYVNINKNNYIGSVWWKIAKGVRLHALHMNSQ